MLNIDDYKGLANALWPLNRSITGNGVRESHELISQYIPLEMKEVASGTEVFDWIVPPEWNVRDAYVADLDGNKIIDWKKNNLHLVGYSIPMNTTVSRQKLLEKLYSIPDLPNAIPYKTTYYKPDWGFCLEHEKLQSINNDEYKVVIDSTLDHERGSLTYSDQTFGNLDNDKVFLLQTYTCHPSMAINELSGPLVLTGVAFWLNQQTNLRKKYHILYAPESIGTITWLSENEDLLKKIEMGLIITCVGHDGEFNYKQPKVNDEQLSRYVSSAFRREDEFLKVKQFTPFGSDERQYNTRGINIPVGSLMRTPYHEYLEYHTSLDNLDILSWDAIAETVQKYIEIIKIYDANDTFIVKNAMCEPFLGKYENLYYSNDHRTPSEYTKVVKWLIHYCDGSHDLLDIAEMSGLEIDIIRNVADHLHTLDLLEVL